MKDEILCPKCNSNQLYANKKGFSGKKAVAGAVLTGGIGILAGTIGSNKIKLTCLACNHSFKPGESKINKEDSNNNSVNEIDIVKPTYKDYKCGNCNKISSLSNKKHCPKCGNRLTEKDLFIAKKSSGCLGSFILIALLLLGLIPLIIFM